MSGAKHVVGGQGGLPPPWVLGKMEAPKGEKSMGDYTVAVYDEEQQKRLGVDEHGHKKDAAPAVAAPGPAWTRGEIEAPEGEKDMGSYKIRVYTAEQQKKLNVNEFGVPNAKRAVVGGHGGLPPHWVTEGLEPPAGTKNCGSYTAAVYTEEQQTRLNVDEHGHKKGMHVGGVASIGPAWTRGEIEAPAGEKDMGTWRAAVYTEEQQKRLGVDEFGHKKQ